MGIDIGTAIASAVIAALVNTFAWFGFRRQIERQDKEIAQQKNELQVIRDERLGELALRIAKHEQDAIAQRRGLHERINACPTKVECAAAHAAADLRMREAVAPISDIRQDISMIREQVARQGGLLDLIARHMGISFPGGPR
jgi:hypothetical protein